MGRRERGTGSPRPRSARLRRRGPRCAPRRPVPLRTASPDPGPAPPAGDSAGKAGSGAARRESRHPPLPAAAGLAVACSSCRAWPVAKAAWNKGGGVSGQRLPGSGMQMFLEHSCFSSCKSVRTSCRWRQDPFGSPETQSVGLPKPFNWKGAALQNRHFFQT